MARVPTRPRATTRVKRSFILLLALFILFLLLQLNQWLPGVWKGGGEGGFRAGGEMGVLDPSRGTAEEARTEDPGDPAAVEAPTEPPKDWPPRRGLLVQVLGADGEPREDWRLGVGSRGGESHAPDDAQLTLRDRRVFSEGFRVRVGGSLLRHRHGLDVPATAYVVHLPPGEAPRARRPADVDVEVVDPATGEPIPDATLTWMGTTGARTTKTDAAGKARVSGEDGEPFPVRLAKQGHVARDGVWVRPRAAGSARVELARETAMRVSFRWADRRPAVVTRLRVHAADGRLLADVRGTGGSPATELAFVVPADEVEDAQMTIRLAGTHIDGYTARMPLKDVGDEVLVPDPRTVRVVARDVHGEPVADAEVVVVSDCGEAGEVAPLPRLRTRTNRQGEARISLAPDQGCHIIVQRGPLGPAARRLAAVDGSDVLELVLTDGVMIPVATQTVGDAAVPRLLRARADVNGVRVEQSRLVGPEEGADSTVGPFPAGAVELYAGARGHAWAARVVEAQAAMGTVGVALERSHPLRLVVEDAFGVPIEGAVVELSATRGEPLVLPPDARDLRTDARGIAGPPVGGGIADVELPDRIYEARISAPGYAPQTVRGLRPGGALHFVTLLPAK